MSTRHPALRRKVSEAAHRADRSAGSEAYDALEWLSRWITLAAFVAAVLVFIAAPILALTWSNLPFAGFTVEPTLVVNDTRGLQWTGIEKGIRYPMNVVRVDGLPVTTSADIRAILSRHVVGDAIAVITQLPDGNLELFRSIKLMRFPTADRARLFWVPYLVGLAYLLIGIWIYLLRGRTRPGRALAFFCVACAVACGLLFDLSTTHAGHIVWTLAVAQLGGALISLALRFPQEWRPVRQNPWLLGIPYGAAITLGLWGVVALRLTTNPWAYIGAWGASYRYAALGALIFMITMLYQSRWSAVAETRRQARIVLFFTLLAFTPIVVWFIAPLLGRNLTFNGLLFLLPLLLFPLGIGLAILRYRLWAIDQLVNRTLVYATLTALLAGLYTASIGLSQRLFVAITGEKSDAAIVMTTLIVASFFTPAKTWLQSFVDRQFKEERGGHAATRALAGRVQAFAEMTDARRLARCLLEDVSRDLQAESGMTSLEEGNGLQVVAVFGPWRGEARLSMPLLAGDEQVGVLQLGPRRDGRPYEREEVQSVWSVASEVAYALRRALRLASHAASDPPGELSLS